MSKTKKEMSSSKQRIFHPLRAVNSRLILLLVLAIVLLVFSLKQTDLTIRITAYLDDVVAYVTRPFSNIKRLFEETSQITKMKEKLVLENRQFKERAQTYEAQYFDYEALKTENQYLRALLPIVEQKKLKTITVVKKPSLSQPFIVVTYPSKEVCQKIHPGALVFSPEGFFGTVVAQFDQKVVVRLVTHIQSRIVVASTQSHKKAVLFGQNSLFFKIKYITPEEASEEPFLEELKIDDSFVEGEFLETLQEKGSTFAPMRIAQIVRGENGHLLAKWVVQAKEAYVTIIIDSE